jgi:hypothetical protein
VFEPTAYHEIRGKVRDAKLAYSRPARLIVDSTSSLLATWWGQKPGGNWYWRCEVPARHLPGDVLPLRTGDLVQVDEKTIRMPRQKGPAAIWQFPGNTSRAILCSAQQAAGLRVLVEVDDNYLVFSPQVPGGDTSWKSKIKQDPGGHSLEAHRKVAEFADGIIVTTEELAKAYREVNDNVYVCRNSVDLADWPEPDKPDDGVFRIGYAASHSHFWDIADVYRALSWAAEQKGVEVVMYGLDPGWSFPYRQVPWTKNLALYRESLSLLNVGVCPLREGTWADAKSDIKLMEYGMAGAASIVARRPPYSEWTDTPEAFTADDPKGFLKHVRFLVQNQDAAREVAAKAKARVLAERTIQHEIERWREAVTDQRYRPDHRERVTEGHR